MGERRPGRPFSCPSRSKVSIIIGMAAWSPTTPLQWVVDSQPRLDTLGLSSRSLERAGRATAQLGGGIDAPKRKFNTRSRTRRQH